MEETSNRKSMSTGTVVTVVLLVAAVISVGAYIYANRQAAPEKEALNTQTTAPQNAASDADVAATPQATTDTAKPDTAIADWKTYTNQKAGYKFQYPSDWVATNEGKSDPAYPFDVELDKGDDHISITSSVYGTLADGSIFDQASALQSVTTDGNYKKIAIAGGGEGYYVVEETLGGPAPMVQLIGDKGTVTMQYAIYDSDQALEAETLFKQMIGTFKFLP